MTTKISLAQQANNAAKRSTFVGNIYEAGVRQAKTTILKEIEPALMKYHTDGYIHIHDLEGYGNTYNCLTLDVLKNFPFETLAEKDDFTKIIQTIEYYKLTIGNIANEQTGGIAFANFDEELHTIFERLTIEATPTNLQLLRASLDNFIYWLNDALTRYGQECYYASLNVGLSTTTIGRFVTKQLLEIYETSTYNVSLIRPNVIFKVHEKINLQPNTPNYDLLQAALTCTSKKMNPTYLLCSSAPNEAFDPKHLSIVGCRTRVMHNQFGEDTAIGRGNIANISINLPRLALEAIQEVESDQAYGIFVEKWHHVAEVAKQLLISRFDLTAALDIDNYPANTKYQLWNVPFEETNDSLYDVFKQGTLSIGFIGLSEAFEVIFGQKIYESPMLQQKSLDFVKMMRSQMNQYMEEEGYNFSLLATSGEGISNRFPDIDRQKFTSPIFEKGYYTNSFHVVVDSLIHPFEKLAIEGPYHIHCNGGSITYVELGSAPLHNVEALYDMLQYAVKSGVSYLGFNYPLDICMSCNYAGTFDDCPSCHSSEVKRIRRVSGYLEDLLHFGKGKKLEEQRRQVNPFTRACNRE